MALRARLRRPTYGQGIRSFAVGPGNTGLPSRPPAGTYDPALDAQLRAAQRGFGDLRLDVEKENERGSTSYQQSLGDINQRDIEQSFDFKRSLEAHDRSYSRSLADILRDRTRAGEDYGAATEALTRQYTRQANVHGEQAAQTGQTGGGFLKAALRARTENRRIDQQPVDTNYNRFLADSSESERRTVEDRDIGAADIQRRWTNASGDLARARANAAQSYQYGVDDRAMQLARGGRELGAYEQDVGAQRFYQATSSGLYNPPAAPKKKKRR